MNNRENFLACFFTAIRNYRYAVIKNTYPDLTQLPEAADIDLVIDKGELKRILSKIQKAEHVLKVRVSKKPFAAFVSVYFNDDSYLEIDLIYRFDRKGIKYMSATEMLNEAEENKNKVKVAAIHHQFDYIICFYLLNHSNVPQRYRDYFASFDQATRTKIFGYITHKYNVHINTLDDLYSDHSRHRKKILKKIEEYGANRLINRFRHRASYLYDNIKSLLFKKGTIITFSGVDGAGKSTILEATRQILSTKYRHRVVVLRHRPSLLPILSSVKYGKRGAEKRATHNLPRQGKNKNRLSSFLRFLYYYADYVFGQAFVYFKYLAKGYTVLYDRYYFDFIIDGKRSNILLSRTFLKWCYLFVAKPKVNFFLYAPEEEILNRKQELSPQDIRTMTDDYLQLFLELSSRYKNQHYLTISNIDIEKTKSLVIKQIISTE